MTREFSERSRSHVARRDCRELATWSIRASRQRELRSKKKSYVNYLSASEYFVIGQVEDVHYELWYGVPPNPQEERLAVFDEIKTVSLQTL